MMSYYEFQDFLRELIESYLNSKLFLISTSIVIVISVIVLSICINKMVRSKSLSISDFTAFNISVKLDTRNIGIAHKMYIQLRTRKIGVPFDEDDVLEEVYNSWFSAFNEIRNLLLEVQPTPQNRIINEIGVKILNVGMRPHLSKWQAKFRKWYDSEIIKPENTNLSPQEVQRRFPEYDELVISLKRSQDEILKFLDSLEEILA